MPAASSLWDAPAQTIELRDYQLAAIEELRARWAAGERKVILCAPTGSGKTVIGAELMRKVWESGSRTIFECDRLALVDQTSAMLRSYGVPHGITQADRTHAGENIVIASAQTLDKRTMPAAQLRIVDEAHTIRAGTVKRLEAETQYAVGLTATPLTPGMGDVWDGIINVATTTALTEEGHLVPPRIYAGVHADMDGAPLSGGEFTARAVEERGAVIIGDIVQNWERRTREHFGSAVKTLVFSATVAHGEQICAEFARAGYDFRQISYRDRDRAARGALIDDFKRDDPGSVMGLVSCEALAKGFDAPNALCLVNAREYRKSIASHIQQLGRVLRTHPGKEYALVLDHTQNTRGFLDQTLRIWDEGVSELQKGRKAKSTVRKEGKDQPGIECKCGMILMHGENPCPGCGHERRRLSTVEHVEGTLEEIDIGGRRALGEVDVEGIGAGSSPGLKRSLWHSICAEVHAQGGGNKRALAVYRDWMGEWPPYGSAWLPEDANRDARVLAKINRLTKAWWARQRKRYG